MIVSEVGSFQRTAGHVFASKRRWTATEEEHLFEYLNSLVSRPELRRALGRERARVGETECTWPKVAQRYAEFLERVANPGAGSSLSSEALQAASESISARVEPEYILSWAPDEAARGYIQTHLTRFEKTLSITPPGGPDDRILEMGSYLQITPALRTRLGYGEVRGCYYGPAGRIDRRVVRSSDGEQFHCAIELFNAEKDRFPYDDAYFSTVLCCELVEHLTEDPMHMMAEINRVLATRRPSGAHYAEHQFVARHRCDSGSLSSRFFSCLHSSAASRARSRKRVITANTRRAKSCTCWRIPVLS